MANCGTLSGLGQACRDNTGGMRKWYIASVDDFDDVTLDVDEDGIVTGSTSISAVTYSTNKNTSSATEEFVSSVENGTVGYDQAITMVFSKQEATKRAEVLLLAQSNLIIIGLSRSGKYFLYGETEGCTLSGGNAASGVALNDLNGYTLNFSAMEPSLAREVSATAMASIITD